MQNMSGMTPTGHNVLVLPDKEKEVTTGGIHLPEQHLERKQAFATSGTLVACSPIAFNYDEWLEGEPPKPGDRVVFSKASGLLREGADGLEYRIIQDKDVIAVLEATEQSGMSVMMRNQTDYFKDITVGAKLTDLDSDIAEANTEALNE